MANNQQPAAGAAATPAASPAPAAAPQQPAAPKTKKPAQEPVPFDEEIIKSLIVNGDLSKLTPDQKCDYYWTFCRRVGLDPITQPFRILRLNGKEILYCDRSGAAQLNKVNQVSHDIMSRDTVNDCYVVTARATLPSGRHTDSIGAVSIGGLRGESLCNAMMKAETKAKRRSTLDLLGLGILDDSEMETISGAVTLPAPVGHGLQEQQPATEGAGGNNQPPAGPTTQQAAAAPQGGGQQQQPHVSRFLKAYATAKELDTVVAQATELKQVANLYYINADLVEKDPDLKAKFTNKKNELCFPKNPDQGAGAAA